MSLLSREKRQQIEWRKNTKFLSQEAKRPGLFRGKTRSFCLPPEHAAENLFVTIREYTLEYFDRHKIHWHTGAAPGLPSNHLCSSQVLMVNLLAPFMYERDALRELLQSVYPDIDHILPIEEQNQYLAFEWTPPKDLLREAAGSSNVLRRGMVNTSIDFAFLYKSTSGKTVLVLGECKYTEPVVKTEISPEKASKRLGPYLSLLTKENSPFIVEVADHPTLFGSEEFYQLFRQQLLAMLVEREYSEKIDRVSLLYLFMPDDIYLAGSSSRVEHFSLWKSSLRVQEAFSTVSIPFLATFLPGSMQESADGWYQYFHERYLRRTQ
jgi:hypothetical protein